MQYPKPERRKPKNPRAKVTTRKNVCERQRENIKNCPRCGGDHSGLEFMKLRQPAKDYQWWAICPEFGEPILMSVKVIGKGEQDGSSSAGPETTGG